MTGRFGSRVASYDNASPLPSDAVTWAHRFRAAGYDVALAGKMHFCGPDQLHGFSANLSRDIHADLWMEDGPAFVPKGAADWSAGIDESDPKGNWHIAEQAGPGTTEEIEVDDDVELKSLGYIFGSGKNRLLSTFFDNPRIIHQSKHLGEAVRLT